MRLLLIVSLMSKKSSGLGGHYNSVRDLRLAFIRAWPSATVEVLTVGNIRPSVFANDELGVHHVSSEGLSLVELRRAVLAVGEQIRPTHVHAFDNKSYAVARLIAGKLGAKRYLTRPGGPNPTAYFPSAPDIVCFSAENRDYLATRRKHRRARLHLIPQRVIEPQWDEPRMDKVRRLTNGRPILLRVARLTSLNAPSLLQTVALSRLLRDKGVDHSLVIVGSPNDPDLVAWLAREIGDFDLLLAELEFTASAEKLTRVARGVVGSGRTLIEAAMAGAVLFAPLAGSVTPTLVTDTNWRLLAETNFSARSTLPSTLIPSEDEIVEAFVDGKSAAGITIAADYRVGQAVCAEYDSLYRSEQSSRSHPVDYVLNWVPLILAHFKTRTPASQQKDAQSRS